MVKIDVKKLDLLPVPAGHKIKYNYIYKDKKGRVLYKDPDGRWRVSGLNMLHFGLRKLSGCRAWLENGQGEVVQQATSVCNPKDTPVKKLGRVIAHNRCIKSFNKALPLLTVQNANQPASLEHTISANHAA